jgi:adenylate kinase
MPSISDREVSDLKDLVAKLESRVHQLEKKLTGGSSGDKSSTESMRMVLMGPPGAGKLSSHRACHLNCINTRTR